MLKHPADEKLPGRSKPAHLVVGQHVVLPLVSADLATMIWVGNRGELSYLVEYLRVNLEFPGRFVTFGLRPNSRSIRVKSQ